MGWQTTIQITLPLVDLHYNDNIKRLKIITNSLFIIIVAVKYNLNQKQSHVQLCVHKFIWEFDRFFFYKFTLERVWNAMIYISGRNVAHSVSHSPQSKFIYYHFLFLEPWTVYYSIYMRICWEMRLFFVMFVLWRRVESYRSRPNPRTMSALSMTPGNDFAM